MIFEIVVSAILFFMACAMAYKGIFGVFLWKWTRIPFALAGGFLLSIGMNGVPVMPVERDKEEETEQVREVETPAEPGNPDDQFARQIWSLKGLTPQDVMKSTMAEAKCSSDPEGDFDGIEWLQERESTAEFIHRKKLERGAV